ncbi:hypothetical protein WJN01_08340, partial [Flavobacteriaceae bacterium SZ-1-7]|uniref:HYR-like domain-containing protein n=1 Tax=Tamlana sedimenti TaxID=3134126 RepID=UPI0031276561
MKKLYASLNFPLSNKNGYTFLVIAFLFLSNMFSGYSQVRVPFTPRTSTVTPAQTIYNVKGDFTMIGNTNMTMVNYNVSNANDRDMRYVDVDGVAVPGNNTFNSSSATLNFSTENGAIPECSNIIYAGLYWTGRPFGNGETDAHTFQVTKNGITKTLDKRKVLLKGPAESNYIEVTANVSDIYYPLGTDGNMYSAYAEITDRVIANGIGEYFVADIACREGFIDATGYYGGWGIVVVYENSKMKWRDITVFDGHAFVGAGIVANYTIGVNGFNAVQSGDVNVKLGLMAGEGDRPWNGDYFEIERLNSGTFQRLAHSGNTTGNFFNSSINTGGNARNPNLVNNTGVDIVMFDIDNTGNTIIANNQTSTRLRYGSTQDTYVIFNATFAVDAYIPESEGIITNTSINGNPPGINPSLEPSENADFTIDIKNTGTEGIDNTVITLPLSEPVDPANLNINYNLYPPLTILSNPNAPFYDPGLGAYGSIVWNLGDLPVPGDPDTILADLSFTLTVTTNCAILSDPDFDPNVSVTGTISGEGDISGIPFNTNLILGHQTSGTCAGEPITGPLLIPIDYLDYISQPPTASDPTPINLSCNDSVPSPDIEVVTDEADNSGIPPIVAFVSDVSNNETCPEIITRTYSVTDDCGNSINVEQTITISPIPLSSDPLTNLDVQSCDFADQAEVDTAFGNWVTNQTSLINITGGCSPVLSNDSATVSIPELCTGGTATVTWTITDLCETINVSADFNLTAPTAVSYNDPSNLDVQSCDFADQTEVDTAFNNWVNAQSTAIAQAGGCSPVLSNDSATVSIPELCTGGTATVTWTITDLCETINVSADFNLTAPTAVSYNDPSNLDAQSCDFADQAEVDNAFSNWVAAQSTAIAQVGGCSPVLSNDSASVSIPELCTGGTATVTWTITDLCETINLSADFNLAAPTAVTYDAPVDDASTAAEFDDPDANVAQANLDADIVAWVAAQTDVITNSIAGGCSPTITNDFVGQSISFCATGSITITWTVQDLCETTNPTATYAFTQPDGINFNNPSDKDVNSCDFDNDNPVVAQNDLDADIVAWVSAQTDIITNSLTGGSPEVTHDFVGQSIDLCNGGNVTVTWFIDDICENINTSATYTVTPPASITYNNPADLDAQSCDFADQTEVDTAFNNWVAAQSTAIAQAGGCSPVLSNDSASVSIPELCTGGTATVTWTITDLCETINVSADFNLTAPTAVSYNDPSNLDAQSCDFADQAEVDNAFSNWVAAQSTAIAQAGGCSPVLSNDSASVSIPELCTGGTATVTWTITDLCETINLSADFNLTAP